MTERNTNRSRWNPTPIDIILMSVESISFIAQIVLCFFFYNFMGLNIVVYLGWAIFLIAMILGWQARVGLEIKGKAREGESWLQTRTVVASGVYAVVRHPMYLSFLLMSLTLVLLSQHWLNALLGVIVMGLLYNDMYREDKSNVEKFGDDYRNYMKQVPRMNFILGILRQLRSSKIDAA